MPTNPHTPETIGQAALAYASRGIKIFPLWHAVDGFCQCSDGPTCGSPAKHPRNRRGVLEASSNETTVTCWWAKWPDANIGLPAGANGLAIIDVDPYHGGEENFAKLASWCWERHNIDIEATYTVGTGSGGAHRYYQQPEGGIKSASRSFRGKPGIDTRGRGGYVVAPPSVHAGGNLYRVTVALPPLPWPAILTPFMEPMPAPVEPAGVTRRPGATDGDRNIAWAQGGLTAECARLRNLPHSEGNGKNRELYNAANKLGQRVGSGWLDENTVIDELLAASSTWPGHGHRARLATIRSGLRDGIADPHPGPTTRAEVAR